MEGKIDCLEEYVDIVIKCVINFCEKNCDCCLVILLCNDEVFNSQWIFEELYYYYEIVWDEEQMYKFKNIFLYLQCIKVFKIFG